MMDTGTGIHDRNESGELGAANVAARGGSPEARFEYFDVDLLHASPTNPRKTFAAESLAELAASFASAGGVIEPLVIRSVAPGGGKPDFYEIVAGERRWRAAKVAKLAKLPCIVRDLTDDQVLEIQVVENLQREDLSPMEQGAGYRTLMEKTKKSAEEIGKIIGKSRRHVYAMMRLATLCPMVAKLVNEGKFSASHGELFARLDAADQVKLAERVSMWNISVARLEEMIYREYYRQLDSVGFPKSDATLVPAAGACTACRKNTAVNADLGSSKKAAMCTDAVCFKLKMDAWIKVQIEGAGKGALRLSNHYDRPEEGETFVPNDKWVLCKPDDCEYATRGVIVAGYGDLGKGLTVCAEPKCKKHHGRGGSRGMDNSYRKQEQELERKIEIERKAREQMWLAIGETLPLAPGEKELQVAAAAIVAGMSHDAVRAVCGALRLQGEKAEHTGKDYRKPLLRWVSERGKATGAAVVLLAVGESLFYGGYESGAESKLIELGKLLKLDLQKFRKLAAAERKDKELRKGARKATKSAPAKASPVQTTARKKPAQKKVVDKKKGK